MRDSSLPDSSPGGWATKAQAHVSVIETDVLNRIGTSASDDQSRNERLARYIVLQHSETQIGTLFPTLSSNPTPILWANASTRLSNVLRKYGDPSWADVAPLSVATLCASWRSFGQKSALELIRGALDTLLIGLEPSGQSQSASAPASTGTSSKGEDASLPTFPDTVWATKARAHVSVIETDVLNRIGTSATDDQSRNERLAQYILHQHPETQLRTLVPALISIPTPILWPNASTRLSNVLRKYGDPSWADVAPRSVATLFASWRSFGQKSALELLRRALDTLLLGQVPSGPSQSASPPGLNEASHANAVLVEAIETVAAWAAHERACKSLIEGLEQIPNLPADELPAPVRAAYHLLLTIDPVQLAQPASSEYSLPLAIRALVESLDERQLTILRERVLPIENRPTLEELGVRFELTRERIRQLAGDCEKVLRQHISSEGGTVLGRTTQRLRRAMGTVMPTDAAERELEAALNAHQVVEGHLRQFGRDLLLWGAGPYHRDGQFLVAGKKGELRDTTLKVMAEVTGKRSAPLEGVVSRLRELGIGEEDERDAIRWLESFKSIQVRGDLVLWWSGTLADKAAVMLSIEQEPMSRERLTSEIGEGSPSSLGNLLRTDARFVRLDRDSYGLAEWGGEAYLGIVGLIDRELREASAPVPLDSLVQRLCSRYSVSESSVRTYASQHPNFIVVDGRVRRRLPAESPTPDRTIRDEPGCYRVAGRWGWRRTVDADILRGSGRAIPTGLADHLGLLPGGSLEFRSEYGAISFSWSTFQPSIGSVRLAARELGARSGDLLFMWVEPEAERAEFALCSADIVNASSSYERLSLLVGADLSAMKDAPLEVLAHALGRDDLVELAEVAAHFRSRGEEDLASLLPSPEKGPSASDVMRYLGYT